MAKHSRITALSVTLVILLIIKFAYYTDYNFKRYYHTKNILTELKIIRREPAANIILNAMLKSGSTYLVKSLENSLGYEWKNLSAFRDNKQDLQSLKNSAILTRQHWEASPENLQFFRNFTDKIIIHVRDPRQVVLSWVHHLNSMQHGLEDEQRFYKDASITPDQFHKLTLHDQIDLSIEFFLPRMVTWLEDWLHTKQEEDQKQHGLEILITTYDEMLNNGNDLYNKILKFYGISADKFALQPPIKNYTVRFRNGDPSEWRSVLTNRQQARVDAIVPQELLSRFGWESHG